MSLRLQRFAPVLFLCLIMPVIVLQGCRGETEPHRSHDEILELSQREIYEHFKSDMLLPPPQDHTLAAALPSMGNEPIEWMLQDLRAGNRAIGRGFLTIVRVYLANGETSLCDDRFQELIDAVKSNRNAFLTVRRDGKNSIEVMCETVGAPVVLSG